MQRGLTTRSFAIAKNIGSSRAVLLRGRIEDRVREAPGILERGAGVVGGKVRTGAAVDAYSAAGSAGGRKRRGWNFPWEESSGGWSGNLLGGGKRRGPENGGPYSHRRASRGRLASEIGSN